MRSSASARRTRAWGNRAKLAATFAAFLLGLLACELAARAFDLSPPPMPVRSGRTLQNVDDPVLAFENLPGGVERIEYRDSASSAPRIVEMHVNQQGFRGPLVEPKKPAGSLRIACIGDSHTFGYGVADDRTWPAALERRLRAREPNRAIEVLNCGVDAYDTLQEVLWLEKKVLAFEPDGVLLQFYVNDTAVRGENDAPADTDWLFDLSQPRREGFVRWLREHSRFADLALDWAYRRRGLAVYAKLRMDGYRETSAGWRRVVEGFRRARDELAARNVRFAVVLYPFLLREGDHLTSHAAFELVRKLCEREHIECFDAEPAFEGSDVDRLRISPHDYHGNEEANEIFARAVEAWMGERGMMH
jgi:lysophospholipase L1-like esterase